ncbi:MAG: UDP-N-acetylmuramoyl-L-alanine--D-glutamate ligase [Treponema sp.]|jgi:UDP-N-acetylmuramoylalanine--D-glutamate ligase|nr:UDP-N-acetylmuramoyl-L-alanine--D-glutamate ligase [Treponema sp.]
MAKTGYGGMKVLVMGLGLNGGGLESARYMAARGAELTVTDLRDEKTLAPSIEKLEASIRPQGIPIRYVLGRHEQADFERADMVIKNPGVRPDSPYLRAARRIETDISLFLAGSPARLTAVTGSKGKSSVSSAVHWVLRRAREKGLLPGKAWLGGNITLNPLSFLDKLTGDDDVVLELSSWQLGDLKGRGLLKPRCAVLTSIMRDHLDHYSGMEAYVGDKRLIYQDQDETCSTVAGSDGWGRSFLAETKGRPLMYSPRPLPEGVSGGWLGGGEGSGMVRFYGPCPPGLKAGESVEAVPEKLLIPGRHQKLNLLAAALALLDRGLEAAFVRESLGLFPGIEHRLEFFHEDRGVRYYNDTAATIPEAAAAAVEAFYPDSPVLLVTGGTDKNLDFEPLIRAAPRTKALLLLGGSGTNRIIPLLEKAGLPYQGPFDSAETAAEAARQTALPGDVVVLSPGCASFGIFVDEFDRGKKWKAAVLRACTGKDRGP